MAIFQRYRMVQETDWDVTYQYGDPVPDRELAIDKVSGDFTVMSGLEDQMTLVVIRAIVRRLNSENHWPKAGSVES
jgi:hypothetical protein